MLAQTGNTYTVYNNYNDYKQLIKFNAAGDLKNVNNLLNEKNKLQQILSFFIL